jgi:hypothetical protein
MAITPRKRTIVKTADGCAARGHGTRAQVGEPRAKITIREIVHAPEDQNQD